MRKNRPYLLALGIFMTAFFVLEGIGFFFGGRTNNRWKTLLAEQASRKPETNESAGIETLQKNIERIAPKGMYIVIDSGKNVLYLRNGLHSYLQAVVSCGSGNILQEPNGERRWIFDTPRGVFSVTSKLKDPSWVKPDWAFVEEGKTIPIDPQDRIEMGVLGDYALGFGDGYFIHGTLYTRLLGRNVTHGCIRVGDEDLRRLYMQVTIGTPIFIY